jgi:DNA-binding MarR family transcriptional regulator
MRSYLGFPNNFYFEYNKTMSETDLQQNVYWLLIRVGMRTKHELTVLAEELGLSPMQLYTLCSLEPKKDVAMNTLSSLLLCDASNVTGIVDRLQTSGYVTRTEWPTDRRVKQILLTDKGVALRRRVIDRFIDVQPASLAGLSTQEIKTLTTLLAKAVAS